MHDYSEIHLTHVQLKLDATNVDKNEGHRKIPLNPGGAIFKGPHKLLPSSGVAFNVVFANKEITKAYLIEIFF